MKRIFSLLLITLMVVSCKNEPKTNYESEVEQTKDDVTEIAYASFGKEIIDDDALSTDRMLAHYSTMKVGDTLNAKMKGKITDVCSKKGCWMKLDMGNDKTVRVTFKDYGFFVPTDASGEVVINGKAFVKEISVDELKHYAEDAGESPEDIAKITEPEMAMSFEADGVLLKK
ncbi:MAG: DUF4920 domain-containing protein [Winogradskyella sp.]|uniref:DUF4920 domain-containing protein n=1 Tax=Winogradskyella sp. TaxID=1883156 RepID=UPI000F40A9B0|nr:DUF4920 domain-containing protein [Winogradskyella sp.]RNC86762.1 MAG: DUF4920 domain-containing protein [Winogradskyella sp.]